MEVKYHPYGNTDPFKIPEIADKLLNEYWNIAEALKIKTCLTYGTCLGFVRDGGYIEGDNDIDVWVFGEVEELISELIKNGFLCKITGSENAHFLKYNILFDVFYDDSLLEYLKSFDKIKYNGRTYNVPHPVEGYLEKLYGDWRTIRHREVWEG